MPERWEDERHDEEADRRDRQDRFDRATEKADPRELVCGRPTLSDTNDRLVMLKSEHCNTAVAEPDDKAQENRDWMRAQFEDRGVDYDEVLGLAYGIGLGHAQKVMEELHGREISAEDLVAFLGLALANAWIDGGVTLTAHLKDGGE